MANTHLKSTKQTKQPILLREIWRAQLKMRSRQVVRFRSRAWLMMIRVQTIGCCFFAGKRVVSERQLNAIENIFMLFSSYFLHQHQTKLECVHWNNHQQHQNGAAAAAAASKCALSIRNLKQCSLEQRQTFFFSLSLFSASSSTLSAIKQQRELKTNAFCACVYPSWAKKRWMPTSQLITRSWPVSSQLALCAAAAAAIGDVFLLLL